MCKVSLSPFAMEETTSSKWRNKALFFSQILVLSIVIIVCLVNISLGNGDDKLWISLGSSALGIILPNPRLKECKQKYQETSV